MALLEREESIGALGRWLTEARDGQGRTVLIEGEEGIGKTALLRAFCGELGAGTRLLWGACDSLRTPRTLGPGPSGRERAGADARHLSRRRTGQQHVPARDDRRARRGDWRVSDRSGAVVARGRRGTRRALRNRRSGSAPAHRGQPVFVREVLSAAGEEIPPTVRDAVLGRLGWLSAAARRALDLVAIVPYPMELWLLQAMLGDELEHLEEALAAGVLSPRTTRSPSAMSSHGSQSRSRWALCVP
jgi:hypothetical protein